MGLLLAAGVLALLVARRQLGGVERPTFTEESALWFFFAVIPAQAVGAVVGAVRQRDSTARAVFGSLVGAVVAGSLLWIAGGLLDSTGRTAIGLGTGPGALAGLLLGWLAGGGDRCPGRTVATAILGVVFVGLALPAVAQPGEVDWSAVGLAVLIGPAVSLVRVPRSPGTAR